MYECLHADALFLLTKNKRKPKAYIPICYNKIYKYQIINGVSDKQKEESFKLITAAVFLTAEDMKEEAFL